MPNGSGGEHEGFFTPQLAFEDAYNGIPADDPFWSFVIGQPPADDLFGGQVYLRGAMTLQALRLQVGDTAFFDILRSWAASRSGGTGTTTQFIALAEQVSGQQLDALFDAWLFTGSKPALPTPLAATRKVAPVPSGAAKAVNIWQKGFEDRLARGRY